MALVGVAVLAVACGGGADTDGPAAQAPLASRPRLSIDERAETFVDRSRTTEAHSTVAASESRTLRLDRLQARAQAPGVAKLEQER